MLIAAIAIGFVSDAKRWIPTGLFICMSSKEGRCFIGVEGVLWYKRAFGAKETSRQEAGGGKLMHAELRIGDSTLYLSDIFPGADVKDPKTAGPSVTLHLWHRDVDRLWTNAVENGATVTMPLDDQFWGDRYGKLLDPYGHSWSLSHKSKLSKKELDRKREEAMRQFGAMAQA